MKKIIPFFIAAVVVGLALSPFGGFRAYAEGTNETGPGFVPLGPQLISDPEAMGRAAYDVPYDPEAVGRPNSVTEGTTGQGADGAKLSETSKKGPDPKGCIAAKTFLGFSTPIPTINFEACAANLMYIIMWIFSWILWLSGKILDMSIYYTLNLSDLLTHVPVVDIGWKIFRDLANIFFIFILLWVAIGTILGLVSGKTKEMLLNLIIVALLMNFSLFITKAVIDGSNIVALHFYNLIVTPNEGNTVGSTGTPTSSFSGAFMAGLKIQTIYQPQTPGGKNLANGGSVQNFVADQLGQGINFYKIILIGIFGIVLMLTAAYVFFVAAILFIIRVVILMIVMILSPLGFLAFALPAAEEYGNMWKKNLINQSLFAPIYLALCFVVVKTIQNPAFKSVVSLNSQDTAASASALIFGGDGSTAGLAFVFNFILLIALMLASILVAKKMGAASVETAVHIGKQARGFVGRQIVRGTYVNAVGGLVGGVASRIGFKDFGKKFSEGAEKFQKKIDINELDKKFKLSKFGATSFGEFIRERTTAGAIIGTRAKFGSEKSVHEAYQQDEKLRERREELDKLQGVRNNLALLETAENQWEQFKKSPPPKLAGQSDDDYKQMLARIKEELNDKLSNAKSVVGSSMNQLSTQGFINLNAHEIEKLITYATLKQVDGLMEDKSGLWTYDEKKGFLKHRYQGRTNQFADFKRDHDNYEVEKNLLVKAISEKRVRMGADGKIETDSTGEFALERDASGNLTGAKIKIPIEPDIKNYEGLKDWARNEMTMHDWELMNLVMPEAYENEMLVGTMRWGIIQDLRRNPYFNQEQRKKMRYAKDAGMRKLVDKEDPYYMEENTETERKAAFAEATKNCDKAKVTTIVEAVESAKATADPTYVKKTGKALDAEIAKKQKELWDTTMARMVPKDVLRERYLEAILRGRAASEIAGMPGLFRNSETLHKAVGSSVLKQWKDKDTEDVVKILEDLFTSFKEDREGIREMSWQNKQALKWLIEDRDGKSFFTDKIAPELQKIREELMDEGKVTFRSDKEKLGTP